MEAEGPWDPGILPNHHVISIAILVSWKPNIKTINVCVILQNSPKYGEHLQSVMLNLPLHDFYFSTH